jgi:nucleoside-diphosphate-sugar epimerase
MTVLITGVYGFLGSHLAKKLCEKHTVIGLYHSDVKSIPGDTVNVYNDLELIQSIPDIIILCHAKVSSGNYKVQNDLLFNSNVSFTEKVINKFPFTKIVYISSVSIFDNNVILISENSINKPENGYAISKFWGENIVLQNPKNYVIRLSSLYGTGMKENTLIPNYCDQAIKKKTIQVWGSGSRLQNYIHVDDAINLIEKIIDYKLNINFPILGVSNKEYSNNEVAKIISDLTNSKIEYINQDNSLSFRYKNKLTQNALNWHSKIDLKEGIKQYLEWKKKQY